MKTVGAVLVDTKGSGKIMEFLEGNSIEDVRKQASELSLYDTRGGENIELYVHEASVEKFLRRP